MSNVQGFNVINKETGTILATLPLTVPIGDTIEAYEEAGYSVGWTWTLQNSCTCQNYNEDDELVDSDDCFGCFDDELTNLIGELANWQTANDLDDDHLVRIEAKGLGWQGRAGYTEKPVSEIIEALFINGDFRIEYTFSNDYKTLTAVRYSHDEPTGTGIFTFTPIERESN